MLASSSPFSNIIPIIDSYSPIQARKSDQTGRAYEVLPIFELDQVAGLAEFKIITLAFIERQFAAKIRNQNFPIRDALGSSKFWLLNPS